MKNRKTKKSAGRAPTKAKNKTKKAQSGSSVASRYRRDMNNNYYGARSNRGVLDGELDIAVGVISCKGDKFGFVEGDERGDIFVAGNALFGARHGDTVRVLVTSDRPAREGGRRREGRVLGIVTPNPMNIVATVVFRNNVFFAKPDDPHYGELLELGALGGAGEHDKVIIDLVKGYGADRAKVVAVLGRADEIGMDVKSVIVAHNLRTEFSASVLDEATEYGNVIDPDEASRSYRADFRDRVIFTIDGSDSKDFDDAVSIERTEGGYRLGVYIADVGEYVKPASALDGEALARGTSVYLADRVIPMLPETLSNGLCSLNEGEDRLTLAAIIDFDGEGNRLGARVCEGVMRSSARLTYSGVQAMLDGDEQLKKRYARVFPSLVIMNELAQKRIALRQSRGCIDFDLDETQISFDELGRVTDIQKKPRLMSMRIIEEFMIAANCAVAEMFGKLKLPFVFRVHEPPAPDKIDNLNDFLDAVGVRLHCPQKPTPAQIAKLLSAAPDDIKVALSRVTLRAMSKADYQTADRGHFGLAEQHYCHFTSPIRRYPDLFIHRVIKAYLRGGVKAAAKFTEAATEAAQKSSLAERTALDCERRVDDYKRAEFMAKHIGESYVGLISSVTDFGFFVELDNTAEGLVRMNTLPPAAVFDKRRMCISCGRARFRLGDRVKITVEKVEGDRIDFRLC